MSCKDTARFPYSKLHRIIMVLTDYENMIWGENKKKIYFKMETKASYMPSGRYFSNAGELYAQNINHASNELSTESLAE
jgi:hypothetical protein